MFKISQLDFFVILHKSF